MATGRQEGPEAAVSGLVCVVCPLSTSVESTSGSRFKSRSRRCCHRDYMVAVACVPDIGSAAWQGHSLNEYRRRASSTHIVKRLRTGLGECVSCLWTLLQRP